MSGAVCVQFSPDLSRSNSGLKTRTELLAKRRHDRLHILDKYDLDGDGVVRVFVGWNASVGHACKGRSSACTVDTSWWFRAGGPVRSPPGCHD